MARRLLVKRFFISWETLYTNAVYNQIMCRNAKSLKEWRFYVAAQKIWEEKYFVFLHKLHLKYDTQAFHKRDVQMISFHLNKLMLNHTQNYLHFLNKIWTFMRIRSNGVRDCITEKALCNIRREYTVPFSRDPKFQDLWNLKDEGNTYLEAQNHTPEKWIPQLHHCKNLKLARIKEVFFFFSRRLQLHILKVLAYSMTSLHLPRSWMQTVKFLIFILQMSCFTLSSHLFLALPCNLVVTGFHLYIFSWPSYYLTSFARVQTSSAFGLLFD